MVDRAEASREMWDSLFPAENSFLEASYANTSLLDPGLDLARYVKLDGSLASARQVPTLFPLGEFDSVLLVCVFLASALGSSVGSRAAPVPVHTRRSKLTAISRVGGRGAEIQGGFCGSLAVPHGPHFLSLLFLAGANPCAAVNHPPSEKIAPIQTISPIRT